MTSDQSPLAAETVDQLREVSTATLTSQLFKLGFRSTYLMGLRPLSRAPRMVGVAPTMRFLPAREDLATYERRGDPASPQRHAIEHIEPGRVLVMPGDVLVGDGDGAVCIPRHVAETIAAGTLEQDRLEAFLLEKVKRGAPLRGTYPPNEATLAEYEAEKRRR